MDYKLIETLMKEMNNSNLTLLEVEENGFRIKIEKDNGSHAVANANVCTTNEAIVNRVNPIVQPAEPCVKEENTNIQYATSPMVGTFYASPSPEKPAFVKVGDTVKKGQTICIIESMKLMNEIESEVDGVIVSVLVSNDEMVEYGQPLFEILPA